MSAVDPRDPVAVAEVLRARAADRWGTVELAEPPSSIRAGFDSYTHVVHLQGDGLPSAWTDPVVVRLLPSVDRGAQAHHEAEAQAWSRSMGYAAPLVLEVIEAADGFGLPAQVMERVAGMTMLDALVKRPWNALRLVNRLARLQLDLHGLETDTWPGSADPRELAHRRLGLTRRAAEHHDELRVGADRLEPWIPDGLTGPLVVCHGDFHPLNVMVDGPRSSVLDWTDAGLGPREADVARTLLLFEVASIAASSAVERVALRLAGPRFVRRYRGAYEAGSPLDGRRMLVWEAMHALHGWSQVVTLHAGGFDDTSSSAGEGDRIPASLGDWLRAHFEQCLAALAR